jgi:hypothetical protein
VPSNTSSILNAVLAFFLFQVLGDERNQQFHLLTVLLEKNWVLKKKLKKTGFETDIN